jgi:hypothetical protein
MIRCSSNWCTSLRGFLDSWCSFRASEWKRREEWFGGKWRPWLYRNWPNQAGWARNNLLDWRPWWTENCHRQRSWCKLTALTNFPAYGSTSQSCWLDIKVVLCMRLFDYFDTKMTLFPGFRLVWRMLEIVTCQCWLLRVIHILIDFRIPLIFTFMSMQTTGACRLITRQPSCCLHLRAQSWSSEP